MGFVIPESLSHRKSMWHMACNYTTLAQRVLTNNRGSKYTKVCLMTSRQRLPRTRPRINSNKYASLHSDLAVGNFRSEGKRVPVKSSEYKLATAVGVVYVKLVKSPINEMK